MSEAREPLGVATPEPLHHLALGLACPRGARQPRATMSSRNCCRALESRKSRTMTAPSAGQHLAAPAATPSAFDRPAAARGISCSSRRRTVRTSSISQARRPSPPRDRRWPRTGRRRSSVWATLSVHDSLLPHGGRNTPLLCCTRKCRWLMAVEIARNSR